MSLIRIEKTIKHLSDQSYGMLRHYIESINYKNNRNFETNIYNKCILLYYYYRYCVLDKIEDKYNIYQVSII